MKIRISFFVLAAMVLGGCDAIKELQDPDYKYAEPYFSKWNLNAVHAYELYIPNGDANNKVISNERDYEEVSGWIEFKKDKDSDESYYRGSFSVTYRAASFLGTVNENTETFEGAFKWSPDEDKNIYVEMDNTDGKVLGVGLSIQFLNPEFISSSELKLTYSEGGYLDSYTVAEFNFTK